MKSGIHNKLDTVLTNQQSLLSRMTSIEDKHKELEKSVIFTSQAVDDMRKENIALTTNLKGTTSELESMKCKVVQLEESTIQLERYSRGFNLRFGGIPEVENEHPYDIIKDVLADKFNLHPEMERAHRSGRIPKTTTDRPRHILVKFLYRPERLAVLKRAKEALSNNGIFVLQDLPAADVAKKRSLREVMKVAYKAGKKPVFRNGNLYINRQKYTPPPSETRPH